MKRLIIIFSSILVAAGAIAFGLTYYKQSQNVALAQDTVQVDLLADGPEPSAVSVEKGKYVQFNTKDSKTHNIGQGSGEVTSHAAHGDDEQSTHGEHVKTETHEHTEGTKESGVFGRDQAYRLQFNEKGTFTFHDHLNPEISIVVVVYEPDNK